MKYYKIASRSRPDQFRGAGVTGYVRWNKSGKTWDTLGKLRALITMIVNGGRTDQFDDWEIVEYEVSEVARYRVHEIVKPELLTKIIKNS